MTTIERNARWTAGSALVLVAVAFATSRSAGQAALAGAMVACGSALLVSRLALAFAKVGDRARPMIALLLVGKSAVVLGASAALLHTFRLDGLGFALGVSALVTGALGAAISGFFQQSEEPSAPAAGGVSSAGGE